MLQYAILSVLLSYGANAMSEGLPAIDSGWDFQDPSASEVNFREFVEQGQEAGNSAYVVIALTQLARSMGLQRRFGDAYEVLDQAENLLTDDMLEPQVRLLLERGRVTNSSGNPMDSIEFFENALIIAEAAGLEYLAIDAAHMLGIVEREEIAIRWNETAIEMAEEADDDRAHGWLGPLYNNLAWTYNDAGEHEQALALFEKDIRYRESLGRDFEASIARWSKAKTLRLLGRTAEALEIQQGLVEHPDRKGKPAEGYTHEEIGECLIVLGQEQEAAPHFAIAFAILKLDPWLVANESERLSRIERLSRQN